MESVKRMSDCSLYHCMQWAESKGRIQAADQEYAHVDDADIRPINDEEPTAEVQTTAEINIFATGQQNTKQPEFINEGEADQMAETMSWKNVLIPAT
ncbi:hypothetical protein Tco_1174952 [Tanacetum coccineum]